MEIGVSGNADIGKIEGYRSDAHFSLDLQTIDAIDTERIPEDLQSRRDAIREQIFRNIADEVIPDMVGGHGNIDAPEQWAIDSNSTATSTMASPEISNGALRTGHHLEMDFSFQADREIDPVAMVYLAREQIAGHIADSTVFDLENRFLGKTESSNSWESSTEDGAVTDYRATEEKEQPVERQEEPIRQGSLPEDQVFDRKIPEKNDFRHYGEAGNDKDALENPLTRYEGGGEEAANEAYYDDAAFMKNIVREDEELLLEAKARLLECRWNRDEALKERRWLDVASWADEMTKAGEEIRKMEGVLKMDNEWLEDMIAKEERSNALAA